MDAPPILNQPALAPPSGAPKRHGCLLTWLILMLIGDCLGIIEKLAAPAITAALSSANSNASSPLHGMTLPTPPPAWVYPTLITLFVIDIVAVIFIFKWKKWAVFLSIAISLVMIVVSLAGGGGIMDAILLLISPVLLYFTLQMGGENRGWRRLK